MLRKRIGPAAAASFIALLSLDVSAQIGVPPLSYAHTSNACVVFTRPGLATTKAADGKPVLSIFRTCDANAPPGEQASVYGDFLSEIQELKLDCAREQYSIRSSVVFDQQFWLGTKRSRSLDATPQPFPEGHDKELGALFRTACDPIRRNAQTT